MGFTNEAIIKTTIDISNTGVITVPILSTSLLGVSDSHNVIPINTAKKTACAITVFPGDTKLDNPSSYVVVPVLGIAKNGPIVK